MFQHHVHELVHPRRRSRPSGADHFFADRVDRADIIDHAAFEADRQFFARCQHVGDAFMRRVAAGQHLAVQQQTVALFPTLHVHLRQRIKVNALRRRVGLPIHIGPFVELGRLQKHRSRPIEREMRVARRGAVGNHRHRLACGMARRIHDLDVEDRRQPAQPLRTDAERVDPVKYLDPHRLDIILRSACLQRPHINRLHQRLLGEQYAMLCRPADADAQHPRRTPARAHLRQHFEHPIDDIIRRVHHLELRLVFGTTALGRNIDRHLAARHQFDMQHTRRIVPGIPPGEGRVRQNRSAQLVIGVKIGAAHAFIDNLLQRLRCVVQPAIHAPFNEDVDDAGILTNRPVSLGAHPAVGQDLRDRVFGGRALFCLISLPQRADIIHRVKVTDILQRVGNALDQVRFANYGRHRVILAGCEFRLSP